VHEATKEDETGFDWENPLRKNFILLVMILGSPFWVTAKYDFVLEMREKTVKSSSCNECQN